MSRPIGEVPTRTFNPGDVIFKEGDDAKSEAFLVHQGKVEIRKNLGGEEKLLRELSQGQLLGEFALFRNIPRSATAIAADAVTLMVIPANRLDAMVRTNDGFQIAELDLELRGPGEFFGTRQAGLPSFQVANIIRDRDLLETAKREAAAVLSGPNAEISQAEIERALWQMRTKWHKTYGLVEVG